MELKDLFRRQQKLLVQIARQGRFALRPDRETHDKILATRTLWLEDASIDLRFLRQLPQLWQLVLKGGGLTAVPEVVWELSRLRELNCSRHTIEQLDPRLAQLEQLEA